MLSHYLGSFSPTISNRLTIYVNSNCIVTNLNFLQTVVGTGRFELPTSRLSVVRSNQLSYAPLAVANYNLISSKRRDSKTAKLNLTLSLERRWSSRRFPYGYLVTTSPQSLTLPWSAASCKQVSSPHSGRTNSHGVTGGVYKARERIHRGMLIRDY